MKKILVLAVSFFVSVSGASDYALIGNIPGEYLIGKDKNKVHLGYLYIRNGVIKEIKPLEPTAVLAFKTNPKIFIDEEVETLELKGRNGYDVIYPGLIDLHNHASRNFFPAWEAAQGQFGNRYDWRNNRSYKLAVASNSGPWLKAENALSCAAFRWNELQSMTLGTTYLQGHRTCTNGYAIHQAELTSAYGSHRKKVAAPSDLFAPDTMLYIWKDLKPYMKTHQLEFGKAFANQLNALCTDTEFTAENVFQKDIVDNKIAKIDWLVANCAITDDLWEGKSCRSRGMGWMQEPLRVRMLRYMQCGHPNIVKRKNYLDDPNSSAFIFHLSEGRRDDTYNQVEFEMLRLIGFDRSFVGLVHALGLKADEYDHMVQKNMGLIWSPYSNLLLYGQTLDFSKINPQLTMAIGSDWTPTGTKSVLEEVKIARNYLIKEGQFETFNDEKLYHMMTSGPAKIINAEGYIGTLAEGAMGSIVVTDMKDENPYTNLVAMVNAEEINLVLVDGNIIYGNQNYLQEADYIPDEYELMPQYIGEGMNEWVVPDENEEDGYSYKYVDLPAPPANFSSADALEKWAYNVELGHWVHKNRDKFKVKIADKTNSNCNFTEPKAFVKPVSSLQLTDASEESLPVQFFNETNVDLDSFMDLQMLLATALMTQNGNIHDPQWGQMDSRIQEFPALYTCNDTQSFERQRNFVKLTEDGEYTLNKKNADQERPVSDSLCRAFDVCLDQ